jgi:hypothetical protein
MNSKNFEKKVAIEVAAVMFYNSFRNSNKEVFKNLDLPKWEALPAWVKLTIKIIVIFRK